MNINTVLPSGYMFREDGLYFDGKTKSVKVCPPFKILGRTADDISCDWGTLIEWEDPAGVVHKAVLPDAEIKRNGYKWVCTLANKGLSICSGQKNRFFDVIMGISYKNKLPFFYHKIREYSNGLFCEIWFDDKSKPITVSYIGKK